MEDNQKKRFLSTLDAMGIILKNGEEKTFEEIIKILAEKYNIAISTEQAKNKEELTIMYKEYMCPIEFELCTDSPYSEEHRKNKKD